MPINDTQGRPKETKDAVIMSVYVEGKTQQGLDLIARREGMTRSKLARRVLDEYVRNHSTGNSQAVLDRSVEDASFMAMPTMGEVLKPDRLAKLSDEDLDDLAKAAKLRFQEIRTAGKRRGRAAHWLEP